MTHGIELLPEIAQNRITIRIWRDRNKNSICCPDFLFHIRPVAGEGCNAFFPKHHRFLLTANSAGEP